MNNKDLDAVMSVYAPGKSLFVFDVIGPPGIHIGWSEYREAFRKMFASIAGPLHFTISDLEIEVSGDLGFSRSLQRVSGVRAKEPKPFDYTVCVTDVYRKTDGKWEIVQEHASLPIDRKSFTPIMHLALPAAHGP